MKIRKLVLITRFLGICLLLATLQGAGRTIAAGSLPAGAWEEAKAGGFDQEHNLWNDVLKNAVVADGHSTAVKYASLKGDLTKLTSYLKEVEAVTRPEFDSWKPHQRLAFLINVYNASTVKLIVDHYPVDSIRDLKSPWDRKFIPLFGKRISLNDVEHKMIRVDFNEPRIHFAVNCASIGCPPLRREAFVATRLEEQLESAARQFLSDNEKNRFDASKGVVWLSKIFQWYGGDFDDPYGGIRRFVAPRITSDPAFRDRILSRKTKLKYLKYDWDLNESDK